VPGKELEGYDLNGLIQALKSSSNGQKFMGDYADSWSDAAYNDTLSSEGWCEDGLLKLKASCLMDNGDRVENCSLL
jgi:hypothetical protein